MVPPMTLHIGQPCHMMHSQGPRRTLPLCPPCFGAGWLSQAATRALVGALRMRGHHPPAPTLSPAPAHVLEGLQHMGDSATGAAWLLQHVGCSSLQPTPSVGKVCLYAKKKSKKIDFSRPGVGNGRRVRKSAQKSDNSVHRCPCISFLLQT